MSEGWIKLHRRLQNHPRYSDAAWLQVWVDLLLQATHKSYRVAFMGKIRDLAPGQLITSLDSMEKHTSVSRSTIRRKLELMENELQLEQEIGNASRLITILNWESFQLGGTETEVRRKTSESPVKVHRKTSESPVELNNNVEKEKNGENGEEGKKNPSSPDDSVGSDGEVHPPASIPKPRARNPLMDAMVSVDGSDFMQATKVAFGQAARALAEIKAVSPDVTAEEIKRRAANYRAHMPGMTIGPMALAKHWAKCGNGTADAMTYDDLFAVTGEPKPRDPNDPWAHIR